MTPIIIAALFCAVAWLFFRRNEGIDKMERMESRLNRLELELDRVKRAQTTGAPSAAPHAAPVTERVMEPAHAETHAAPPAMPPPIPPVLPTQPQPVTEPVAAAPVLPPVTPVLPPVLPPQIPVRPRVTEPAINFEKFLGVKLFAWVGGLLVFLAAVFFIKYSFEKNWITPLMRVAFGYLVGIGLVVGGLFIPRQRHVVTVQTLCATGLLVLYANIFASRAYFHFIGATPAFVLMALVTATAFYLAVRLDAQVVAILGLLGGFLTPPLLSTGVDNPGGLFGYLALLDIGLLAVAVRQRWNHLTLLAAIATAVMQFGWVSEFFAPQKNAIAMTIFLGFSALFLAAFAIANYYKRVEQYLSAAVVVVLAAAMVYPLYILWHPHRELAQHVVMLFSFVFAIDAAFLALAWLRDDLRMAQVAAGGAVFLLLASWTGQYLTAATLNAALGFYLLFAVLHSVFPVVSQRVRGTTASSGPGWSHVFPALALVLVLIPVAKDTELSWMLWPVVLAIDLVAIVLAIFTTTLASILVVFLLTALLAACWIMQGPAAVPDLSAMLIVIGGFSVFFMAASVLAGRKVFAARDEARVSRGMFGQIASLSAMLPFLLLAMVTFRLRLTDPTPVFAMAAFLIVLMLAVVRLFEVDWLAPVGLASVLMLEHVWLVRRFFVTEAHVALSWYVGFGIVFLAFPFLFQRRLEKRVIPWATAALALPLHFFLIYRGVLLAYPNFDVKGLIPAVLAIPCLVGLTRLVLTVPKESPMRNTLFAFFGGVSLFFITFIFPIQFERHWITIGWALEGAALVWLFHRVPHPGLRLVGVALLVTSFSRLALNPWVITEYGRTGTPIWNWYLYTYGIVTIALFVAARLLAPPRNKTLDIDAPPLLYTLGAVLAFLLVNIEIADYFNEPGSRLTFNFSGSLGQDMAYSLAWGLFAFALLAVGFKINHVVTRYSGMGLLVVTVLKLFLHDLWRLGGLYRIGSLIGLAVVLIVVSFIYQRFLSSDVNRKTATAGGVAP